MRGKYKTKISCIPPVSWISVHNWLYICIQILLFLFSYLFWNKKSLKWMILKEKNFGYKGKIFEEKWIPLKKFPSAPEYAPEDNIFYLTLRLEHIEPSCLFNHQAPINSWRLRTSYTFTIYRRDVEESLKSKCLTRTFKKTSHTTLSLNIKLWLKCLI